MSTADRRGKRIPFDTRMCLKQDNGLYMPGLIPSYAESADSNDIYTEIMPPAITTPDTTIPNSTLLHSKSGGSSIISTINNTSSSTTNSTARITSPSSNHALNYTGTRVSQDYAAPSGQETGKWWIFFTQIKVAIWSWFFTEAKVFNLRAKNINLVGKKAIHLRIKNDFFAEIWMQRAYLFAYLSEMLFDKFESQLDMNDHL